MVKVKICGITNLQDALMAIRLGADAVGFVFAKSPRQVTPAIARQITSRLGPYVTRVGVFVNPKAEDALRIASTCSLDAVQLHGDESPALCRKIRLRYKVIKTFRAEKSLSRKKLQKYEVDAYLLETPLSTPGVAKPPQGWKAPVAWGGTGRAWDWKGFAKMRLGTPLIVSGGLRPSNVRQAVRILKPYAVDVSSGVETRPGKKNARLIERFIKNAKGS